MRRAGVASLACLFLLPGVASADQIRLKAGGMLEGRILEETPEGITLESPAGTFQVSRDRIEAIHRKAYVPKPSPPPPPPAPSGKVPAAAEPAPDPVGAALEAKVASAMGAFRSFELNPEAEREARGLLGLGRPAVPAILARLEDADPFQQKWLADVLGLLKDPAAGNALLNLIHSPHEEVRSAAARALGLLKPETAVQPLINLLKDKDVNVRLEAVRSLSSLQAMKAVPALIPLLADADRHVRSAAYDALTGITGESLPSEPEPWREWLRQNPIGTKEFKDLTGRPRGSRTPPGTESSP